MNSNRIKFSQEIAGQITALNPADLEIVNGVLSLLGFDYWRKANKVCFGGNVWAVAEEGFTVGFVEMDDGTIFVVFLNERSKFHPSWL